MGKDVQGLCAILRAGGHHVSTASIPVPPPRLTDLDDPAREETLRLYRAFGGTQREPQLRPGSWDILVDGVLVEIDEQLHFNRDRAVTLASPCYRDLNGFPLERYRRFCVDYEAVCLKHGSAQGRWMNPSTERHFGSSGRRGDLSGAGPSRWKQRALNDFMKDVAMHPVPLARIAIWDVIPGSDGPTVESVVNQTPDPARAPGLWDLVTSRCEAGP
jgi:hypothetical protein